MDDCDEDLDNNTDNSTQERKKQTLRRSQYHDYDKKMATAFRTDCEEFLERFEKLQSLKFSDFANIWKQQQFTFIFAGQRYALCLKNFCEDVFYIVKKFIIFPKSLFTQVGALYMLYGLYYKQPLKQWVKIRLTLDECRTITDLVSKVTEKGHRDAAYIFMKLKLEAAFIYVALRKPLGPEDRFIKTFESYYNDTFGSSKVNSTIDKFNNISSSQLVQELNKTNTEYEDLLNQYSKNGSNLLPFTSTIVKDIQDACTSFNKGEWVQQSSDDDEGEKDIRTRRRSIRDKAMLNKNATYRGSKKVKTALDEDIQHLTKRNFDTTDSDDD